MSVHRGLLRAGFLLVLLGLLAGTVIPAFHNPRMGVSAHLTGVLNGMLLIALGLGWEALRLSARSGALARGLFLYGTYANWAGTVLAAAWGTQRLTPVAGAGFAAPAWKELVVQVVQLSLVLAMLVATGMVVYALRPQRSPAPVPAARLPG